MFQNLMQSWKSKAAIIAVASAGVCALASSARAVIITGGQTLSTTGESLPAFGAPLYDTGNVPFSGTNPILHTVVFSGTLDTKVYTDPTTNDLDFVYQFTNSSNSPDFIETFSCSSFSGDTTDADYITGTGATFPASVTRNAPNSGGSFNFPFSAGVAPGATTADIIIKTNATQYTLGGTASFQDGGNVTISAPAPVPEPATAAVAGLSMLALGARRRRR